MTPSSAGARRSSQPIVAEPNVASWSGGIGCPATTGSAAWWSAVVAVSTCGVPHTRTTSTAATATSPAAIDQSGANRATSCATVMPARPMSATPAPCATSAVREPRDEPQHDGRRQPPRPGGGEQRRSDRACERERVRPARDGADDADADAEHRRRDDDAGEPSAAAHARRARSEDDRGLRGAEDGVRGREAQLSCGRALRAGCGSPRSSATSTRSPAAPPSAPRRSAERR